MVPLVQVAVRDKGGGRKHLFHIQSEEITTYLTAVRLVLKEIPTARTALVSMPIGMSD